MEAFKPSNLEFNPSKQLESVIHLSRTERIKELESLKHQYVEQRTALASMQLEMIGLVKKNPNIEKEELLLVLDKYASQYGFTPKQNKLAKNAIDIFLEHHYAVHALRSEHPDDIELFTTLYNSRPLGSIKIEERPISLSIECSNVIDYSKVHEVNKGVLEKIKFILKRYFALHSSAGVTTSIPIPGIKGRIVARDISVKDKRGGDYLAHEEQHAMWRLIMNAYQRENTIAELSDTKTSEEETEKELLEDAKSNIYVRIEDEMLAMVAGKRDAMTGANLMSFQGYLETYIKFEVENLTKGLIDAQESTSNEETKRNQEQKINKVVQELETKDFHSEIIDALYKSANAMDKLEQKGYSREEVVALFTHENLLLWPKLANRLPTKIGI